MTWLRQYLYGIAAMFVLGLIIGAYVKGRGDALASCDRRVAAIYAEAQQQKDAEAERQRSASASFEKETQRVRTVYRDIVREVDKIIDRPVYTGVCLDDDGVSVVNRAFAGSPAAPAEPDPAVPAVEPTR